MDMRKLLTVIGAIGIITASLAGAAAAAQDTWTVLITAGDGGGTYSSPTGGSGGRVFIGTNPNASDGQDGMDGTTIPPQIQPSAMVALYRPEMAAGGTPDWHALRDIREPLGLDQYGKAEIKVWEDIVVWAAPGYSAANIHLYLWTNAALQPPASVEGQPVAYKLQMTAAPESYDGQTEWVIENPGTALLLELILPSAGAISANPITGAGGLEATQVAGYRFNFVTPEPGSMMVLATGITGLMGLVARRRKA